MKIENHEFFMNKKSSKSIKYKIWYSNVIDTLICKLFVRITFKICGSREKMRGIERERKREREKLRTKIVGGNMHS